MLQEDIGEAGLQEGEGVSGLPEGGGEGGLQGGEGSIWLQKGRVGHHVLFRSERSVHLKNATFFSVLFSSFWFFRVFGDL